MFKPCPPNQWFCCHFPMSNIGFVCCSLSLSRIFHNKYEEAPCIKLRTIAWIDHWKDNYTALFLCRMGKQFLRFFLFIQWCYAVKKSKTIFYWVLRKDALFRNISEKDVIFLEIIMIQIGFLLYMHLVSLILHILLIV